MQTASEQVVADMLAGAIRLYKAKYPGEEDQAHLFIVGEAVAHVIFTLQRPSGTGLLGTIAGGVAKAKEDLMIEAVPFSYMDERLVPRILAEYLRFRASDEAYHPHLAKCFNDALSGMPAHLDREGLVADAQHRRIRWVALVSW